MVVHDADVARVQPCVGVDGRLRLRRLVEVAEHHVVAAHDDLARVASTNLLAVVVHDVDLDAGDGTARGGGDGLRVVVVATHGGDPARFGQPVARDHRLEAEHVMHLANELDRDEGGAGHGQAQR